MSIKLVDANVRIINPYEQYIDITSEYDLINYEINVHGLRENGLQPYHFFRDAKNNILDYYEPDKHTIWINIPYLTKGISTIYLCDKKHTTIYLYIKLLIHNLKRKIWKKNKTTFEFLTS